MKKLLFAGLLLSSIAAQAQQEYTIEGQVKGLKNGAVITLFLTDGQVGSSVASDTVRNETFRFKRKVTGSQGVDELSLSCRSEEFPSMGLKLFATAGSRIQISGTDNLIHTWHVKSPVKKQQEYNKYIEASREQWEVFQRLAIKRNTMRSASKAEREKHEATVDSVAAIISKQEMVLMQKMSVSDVWIDKLATLCMRMKYDPKFLYKKETIDLYNRMNEQQKATIKGQEITVSLFPPTIVKEGDLMADADLYDLNGKVHHLADFKGKYILLDFWSSGCGPCIMALPEMREISEQYKDRLVLVSLSSDTESRWRKASAEHEMAWLNLNDLKQRAGLYAKYGVRGIPNYVMISPEGKIIKVWAGYGKGSLKLKMRRLLDSSKHEMSISQQGDTKLVNYPTAASANTDVLEMKQVELTDTATTIHFKAYYIPKYWIRINKDAKLIGENNRTYAMKQAVGITPGKEFYMPESGETEFSITFEALPKNSKTFNYLNGIAEGDWYINGIKLMK